MKPYQSLSYWTEDLDLLPQEQRMIFETAWEYYLKKPGWTEFANFTNQLLNTLNLRGKELTELLPICEILADLEGRLGLEQGKTSRNDYRSVLYGYIARYYTFEDFAKKHNLDKGFLVMVIGNRKAHFSLEQLQEICDKEGLDLLPRKPFNY